MRATSETRNKEVRSFRTRLFTAIMVIVATLTALGFYLAQRRITADAERNLQETFKTELSSMHELEELRHATLADRCNALAGKPRIQAAECFRCWRARCKDRSSTFPQQVAGYTANRLCPIRWTYS